MTYAIVSADNRHVLAAMPENSVDAIVTDPPYELGFMGKRWDASGIAFDVELWRAVLRVLKPGGHLLAFSGTRTYHRMVVAIEDAGFEIRDQLNYLFGTGFPKSLNVSKQLEDRAVAAAECDVRFVLDAYVSTPVHACRECGQVLLAGLSKQGAPAAGPEAVGGSVRGEQPGVEGRSHVPSWEGQLSRCEVCTMSHGVFGDGSQGRLRHGASARDGDRDRAVLAAYRGCPPRGSQPSKQRPGEPDAVFFQRGAQEIRGTGTALKPAMEPIVLARRPLIGTVAANVLAHGTGGINVDACRIGTSEDLNGGAYSKGRESRAMAPGGAPRNAQPGEYTQPIGRWPANVLLDEEASAALDEQSGTSTSGVQRKPVGRGGIWTTAQGEAPAGPQYGDTGGASRFFYTAKASKSEREAGLTEQIMLCQCTHEDLIKCVQGRSQPTISPKAPSPPRATTESVEAGATSWLTDGSGNRHTGPYPTDSTSTTSTKTSSTTISQTSPSSIAPRTNGSTADARSATDSGGSPAESVTKASRLARQIGISAQRGGRCTDDVGRATSRSSSAVNGLAVCVICDRWCSRPSAGALVDREDGADGMNSPRAGAGRTGSGRLNVHSTVKPIALMRYLVRLITPPGGIVLDPFAGSGSTIAAAVLEGFNAIGIDLDPEYCNIARARVAHWETTK